MIAAAPPAVAAPESVLWERWTAHGASDGVTVDHSAWSEWLPRYVVAGDDGVHRVAYARVSRDDRRALDQYLARLSRTRVSELSRAEQRPFWINLYNALTVQVVLDHYPVESIRDIRISPGWFSVGPWGRRLVEVEGVALSLDDIEHRILRPIWQDPRIHYAVNCASIGCPNLAREAYTGENSDALLDAAARAYVNHPRGAAFVDGRLVVSSIYDWFATDFGGTPAGVVAHLREYAEPALRMALERNGRIADYRYDWDLNDASAAR